MWSKCFIMRAWYSSMYIKNDQQQKFGVMDDDDNILFFDKTCQTLVEYCDLTNGKWMILQHRQILMARQNIHSNILPNMVYFTKLKYISNPSLVKIKNMEN